MREMSEIERLAEAKAKAEAAETGKKLFMVIGGFVCPALWLAAVARCKKPT